jgi:hypothetical protein
MEAGETDWPFVCFVCHGRLVDEDGNNMDAGDCSDRRRRTPGMQEYSSLILVASETTKGRLLSCNVAPREEAEAGGQITRSG